MTNTLEGAAFMAFAEVPPGSQNYRRAIVRNAPEHYTATIQNPLKIGGAWYYGVHVSRDVASPRGSIMSPQRSPKSLLKAASSGFFIRRRWEDCLDLQKLLETEVASMKVARQRSNSKSGLPTDKRFSSTRLYPSERAASFESLPCGDTVNFLENAVDGVPKLSRKASLFKASQAVIQKRHVEFAGLVGWLFGVEYSLAEDLRHCTSVQEWFSYWRSDKEMEGKVRLPTAPASTTPAPVTLPPTLGMRGRGESVSSMTTMSTATSSEMSSVPGLSPEQRVSGSFRPGMYLHMQDRPLSTLTDLSSEEYFDELDKTIDTFPAPPPLRDEAVRALSPGLRKRAASSDQLSRLGLMTPVPERDVSPETPVVPSSSNPQSTRDESRSPPLRATLPPKPRHWKSMLNLRDPSFRSLASSPDIASLPVSPTVNQPQPRDPRALSSHARSNSKYRNCMFLSAPNTPHLGGSENEAGFVYPPRPAASATAASSASGSPSVPWTAGSDSSFFNSSPIGSTPDIDRDHLAQRYRTLSELTRTDSSRSSQSSENVARLPYATSNGSHSTSGLNQDMLSSVSTLSTDFSEPAEDERASMLTTPLPPAVPPLPVGLTRSRGLPDGLVSRLMMGTPSPRGQDGFSRPSSGEQDLIDDYLYSTIEESLSEATRSLTAFTESFDISEKKYYGGGESWLSMDLDEETMPILLEKDLPPSPQLTESDPPSEWSSPRKQSVHSFISSPDQFPKSFQHRPPGQFHLPWSSPTTSSASASTPPKTPPGDSLPSPVEAASPVPTFVVKAHHASSGAIVSFRAPRALNLAELRERLEQKFIDSEDLVLGQDSARPSTWRLAYSPNQLNKLPSRRNLSSLTSVSSPGSVASGRTRSDSGMSLTSLDVESLTFINNDEQFTSALSTCGAGKLTLHIME